MFLRLPSHLALNDFGAWKADITLSIPKAWAVIKTAEFPLAVKENLSNVVEYELDRITPFGSDDAFFDFRVVDEKEDKLVLLVIAAKADMIKPYIEALREKGVNVKPDNSRYVRDRNSVPFCRTRKRRAYFSK